MARTSDSALKGATFARLPAAEDGYVYPGLVFKGDAPRKGSAFRVEFDGVTYDAKAHAIVDRDGQSIVETRGLTPVVEGEAEADAAPVAAASPAASAS